MLAAAALAALLPADPPAPAPARVRVLCYNVHHGRGTDNTVDLPRIAKVITAARPDLVALQEVDRRTRRTGGVDQTAELARLTGLHGLFAKQIDYDGGEYGQAVLSRTPVPGGVSVHRLPGRADREQRIAAEVRVKLNGEEVAFVSTHLHHADPKDREAQAAKLVELFAQAPRPVILAGDLNAEPGTKPLKALGAHFRATLPADRLTFPSPKPVKQIDFVLARPGKRFRVVEAAVVDEPVASDHRPVLAVLELLGP